MVLYWCYLDLWFCNSSRFIWYIFYVFLAIFTRKSHSLLTNIFLFLTAVFNKKKKEENLPIECSNLRHFNLYNFFSGIKFWKKQQERVENDFSRNCCRRQSQNWRLLLSFLMGCQFYARKQPLWANVIYSLLLRISENTNVETLTTIKEIICDTCEPKIYSANLISAAQNVSTNLVIASPLGPSFAGRLPSHFFLVPRNEISKITFIFLTSKKIWFFPSFSKIPALLPSK